MKQTLVEATAVFDAHHDDFAQSGAIDVAVGLFFGGELRPVLRVLTIVRGDTLEDGEVLLEDGSEGIGAHRGCLEKAMQIRWKHFAESIECVGFEVEAIALQAVPRAEVTFKDFEVDVGVAKRLGKAKTAKTSANNEYFDLRHKRPFSSQRKGRTGDRFPSRVGACTNALASPGLPTGPWLSHVQELDYTRPERMHGQF